MSVETTGGGLSFDARINLTQLEQDADKAVNIVAAAVEKAAKAEQALLTKISGGRKAAVEDGLEALKSLTPEMQKQVAIVQSFQTELKGVSDAQKELDKALSRGVITQKEYNQASQGLNVRQAQINENIRKYTDSMRANQAIMDASKGSVDQKRLKLQQLTAQYYALSEAERQNASVGGKMAREIRALDRDVNKLTRSLNNAGSASKIFNQIALATAGLFTINQAGRFATDIIRVRGEIEQLEVAFTTILKSKAASDVLIGEITQLALKTPFKLTELADGAKQLLAYGFAAKEVKEELISIGNIAAGTGSTFQEVAYAYGTLRSQGRAFARDIRQFTGRGIPIVSELAKQLQVSEERVNDLVTAGKIGFPEVQKAFQGMTTEGGVFFNLMQEQSKTVTGQLSNLQDAIELMFNSIGEGNEGFIKSGISGLTSLVNNYERVVEILGIAVVLYGSYRAALLLTVAAQRLAAVSSGTMTAATILQNAQTVIAAKVTAIWGAAMAALPLVALSALISALVLSIYSWNQAVDTAAANAENLKKIQDESAISAAKEKLSIEELVRIIQSENASIEQKTSAYKQLQSLMGPYLDNLSLEEIAQGKAADAIDKKTEATKRSLEVLAAKSKYDELGDRIIEIEQKGIDAIGSFERAGQSLKNTFAPENLSFKEYFQGLVSNKVIIEQITESLKKQREELAKGRDFNNLILGENGESEQVTGFDALITNTERYFETLIKIATDKSQFDKIKEGLQNQLEALAPNDPQIAELKKKIQRVNEVLKSYSLTDENKAIKDAAKDRKKVLDDISKLEDEAFKDSFSKREQEINATKKQFEQLREEAKKAGLGAGVMTRIDRLEEKTTGNIVYRDETKLLQEELEKRKTLYRDFDTFALTFGIQAAEDRYRTELDIAKTYLTLIQEEFEKLSAIDPADRTGVQKERFEYLEKEVREEKRFQQKKYDDFLATVQTYEMERAQLIETYALRRQQLIEQGDKEYLAQLDQNYKDELGALDDAQFQKLGVYKAFFNGLENMSVKSAQGLIKDLRKVLIAALNAGTVTKEFYDKLSEELNSAENQTAKRIPENLRQIAQGFRQIAQEIGGANSGLGRMLSVLGDSLDRVAAIKSGIADFNTARDKGDILGAASAGLGVAGAAIGVISQVVGIIKEGYAKQLETQKKQLELQRQIYFGELDINRLYRERRLAAVNIEESTLRNLLKQREILKSNMKEISDDIEGIEKRFGTKLSENTLRLINSAVQQNRDAFEKEMLELAGLLYDTGETGTNKGGLFGLSKQTYKIYKDLSGLSFEEIEKLSLKGQLTEPAEKLFQQLKKLKEEGIEVENQFKEIDDALKAIFTGNQTAINIADTLIAGFRQGKRAVEDFGDDIEEILRNAILSGFKYRFLEEPLNALLKQLYDDAVSDDDLSESEISNFQAQIAKIIEQYGKVFDELSASTGIDLGGQLGGKQQGLSGAIRRELTEETAGELAGLFRGQFDITKRMYQIGVDQLGVQLKIEQNTFISAQRLTEAVTSLDKIVKNTDPASARGSGYDG